MTGLPIKSLNDNGDFDFRHIGSFVTQWRASDGTSDGVEERYVWECRFCFSLTNSPEDHWRISHRGDEDLPLDEQWMNEDQLRIER